MNMCVYCKQEDVNTICLSCDGKHLARDLFKRLQIEKSHHLKRFQHKPFDEEKNKQKLIERDILGLEGLKQGERDLFFSAFSLEWSKQKQRDYMANPQV